jgi:hypothetical protein
MTKTKIGNLLTVGLLALAAQQAHAISLDYSSHNDAKLQFVGTGNQFSFVNSTTDPGYSFAVSASDGVGDSIGLLGTVSGSFTIGTPSGGFGFEGASVSGTGVLSINDGFGFNLTGLIQWNSIFTLNTSGGANDLGSLNLFGMNYGGANQDLIALAADLGGIGVATFQFGFIPAKNLTLLTTDGQVNSTTFTGDLQADVALLPDGGATIGMLGFGLLALAAFRRKTA